MFSIAIIQDTAVKTRVLGGRGDLEQGKDEDNQRLSEALGISRVE